MFMSGVDCVIPDHWCMVTRVQVWDIVTAGNLKCPLYPGWCIGISVDRALCGLWWVTWARHWPLIGRYCDGSCLHLGQRWKWWAWKMFWRKVFLNTWLWTHGWRSVNLILIQFPCPGYLLSTEVCPMDHHYWRRLTLIISINNNPGLHSSG